jgi:CelD/BcsL family acetyltransferase involved in cellulose biosynthesis
VVERADEQLRVELLSAEAELAALAPAWDELVCAMPRPSPFLLNAWLVEWWRHFGDGGRLAVLTAFRGDRLVAGLPLFVRRRLGLRTLEFVGGTKAALADVLLGPKEGDSTAALVAEAGDGLDHDFANVFGLPVGSRLTRTPAWRDLRLIERLESPVLDLSDGWDAVYERRFPPKARQNRRRRRRQLDQLGSVEISIARKPDELGPAFDEAARLYALRWRGRREGSGLMSAAGADFYRSVLVRLAGQDVPRVLTLRVDGRPVAANVYLLLSRTLYGLVMAFDPAFARYAPGSEALYSALEAAAGQGVTRAEFLGAATGHKQQFTDRVEPIYQGIGLEQTVRGRLGAGALVAGIRLRRRAKRSETARRLYAHVPRRLTVAGRPLPPRDG